MDIKRLTVVFLSVIGVGCAAVPTHDSTEYESFKKSAMAICVGSAFSDEAVKSDFNKSANGFMERGNMPLGAYQDLRALVNKWLRTIRANTAVKPAVPSVLAWWALRSYDKYDPCDSEEGWLNEESCR